MITSCILLLSLIASVFTQQTTTCPSSVLPANAASDFQVVETVLPYYNPYPCILTADAFVLGTDQFDLSIASNSNSTLGSASTYTCGKGWIPGTGYGFYNCNMKVSGIAGTVTSCVAESSVDTPYENVYIKFFGNDTTEVHVGFFTAGRVQQAGPLPLDFDPTAAFHVYSFEVTTNYIKWYVDGVERSSEYGARQLPVSINRFTISYTTEQPGFLTENSAYFTDATVGRDFTQVSALYPNGGFVSTISFQNITFSPQALGGCAGFNPGQTPDTSDACDDAPALAIYTDGADNLWTITATEGILADETTQIYAGAHSEAFTILPGALLTYNPPKPFPSTDYYSLEMWINGGPSGSEQIMVSAILDGNALTAPLSLATLLVGVGGLAAGTWTHVVIPINGLGLSPSVPTNIHGFQLSFPGAANGGSDAGHTIYLDEIYLIQQYPICANSSSFIYTDSLAQGVTDQSYGGRYNLASTSPVYSGAYAISWDMFGYDGLKFAFATPFNTSFWEAISFRVNLLKVVDRQWSIYFTSADSTAQYNRAGAAPLNLVEYYGGVYPAGTWPLVVIPLREFGIGSGINIDGIVFSCDSNTFQGTLALDDIAFISSQVELTSPSSSSDATTVVFSSLFTVLMVVASLLL